MVEKARMAEINEHLKTTYVEGTKGRRLGEFLELRKQIKFVNGFGLSAQGSHTSYCTPRDNHFDFDHYYDVELALFYKDEWTHPGRHEELAEFISLWEEDDEDKSGCHVAGYVSKEDFWRLVDKLDTIS